jgi:ABC-type proline/glycine betaine transport system substrate-binding protein
MRTVRDRGVLALAAGFLVATTATTAGAQEPARCDLDRPIVFAGLDWDSAQFHNEVARFILEEGYGCATDAIPGSTLPLLAGMARGDVDVTMEIWIPNFEEAWQEQVEAGNVAAVGVNFPDAEQAWFVPRYLVEGEDAEAPDLASVFDLPEYRELFRDPEAPDQGRFYNCILGWACEEVNTKKLHAYGLADDFTNFRPGAAAALAAAITSHYKRRQPFVAYYWGPTWVLGQYDLVALEEPPYTEACWENLKTERRPEEACAYPTIPVSIGVNTDFQDAAPTVVAFLERYETTSDLVSAALSYIQENSGASARDAAVAFLETNTDLWTTWVPEDVAADVRTALGDG